MKSFEDWIDFMEEELTAEEQTELELMLRHSVSDRMIYQNLSRLREEIKASDPAEVLLESKDVDSKFLEKLHRKTMSKIINSVKSDDSDRSYASVNSNNFSTPEMDFLSPHIFYRIR